MRKDHDYLWLLSSESSKQKLERQIKNIKKAHLEIEEKNIYLEEWTGTTLERPIWKKLEKKLKEGDTLSCI